MVAAMASFFVKARNACDLLGHSGEGWRQPQLGAVGAVVAHWSLESPEPTVISVPTGTGKTAVALVAPLLLATPPNRVLVMGPSRQLREQLAAEFGSYDQLRRIGVLAKRDLVPRVHELTGKVKNWSALEEFEVVVALPNSISPAHYDEESGPPSDLFDLVIIDEAHHAPARSWTAVLQHFGGARALLLTATPRRRDGRPIPGSLEFYYPLRRALEEGFYKPITPALLPAGSSKRANDESIAQAAARLLAAEEHSTSVLLVRAATVTRLKELRDTYLAAGVDLTVLHSRLSKDRQLEITHELRGGEIRAVGVVGMLGEGFDLPAIRLLAYHDKHRSAPATLQLIGRLARVDKRFPQAAQLVTVTDGDVYPALRGVLRELYAEDADWASVLPGILDEDIQKEQQDRQFVRELPETTTQVDPRHLNPLKRAVVYEVPADWTPEFLEAVPEELDQGARIAGGTVQYAGANEGAGLFVVVIRYVQQPKWSSDPALANVKYELHLAAHRRPPRTDLPGLVLLNVEREGFQPILVSALGLTGMARLAAPERISGYLDGLERLSVSSVGVRNTNAATRGRASYRNYMGSGVDRGLRSIDMARSALGHVMFQVNTKDGSANAGAALEKSKLWMTRYGSLRDLSEWVDTTCRLLWFSSKNSQGPLLPAVDRGQQLTAWPETRPLAAELPPTLLGTGLELWNNGHSLGGIEDLDLFVNDDPTGALSNVNKPAGSELAIVGVFNDRQKEIRELVWEAAINVRGEIAAKTEIEVGRGYGPRESLSKFLEREPPTIYFLDGSTTVGPIKYDSRRTTRAFDLRLLGAYSWPNVDITAETRRTAAKRAAGQISIHERLEEYLRIQPRRGIKRWILCNDGSGEIADYIVIEELTTGEVALGLWHAKYAHGTSPSVRIADFQEVVAQAIRSRASLASTELWDQLRKRLLGQEKPIATHIVGSDDPDELLERLRTADRDADPIPWTRRYPSVAGAIGVVQPGLSVKELMSQLEQAPAPAGAVALDELFNVLADTALSDGASLAIVGSA
jgi:superfamily II DNA or RNA helicase